MSTLVRLRLLLVPVAGLPARAQWLIGTRMLGGIGQGLVVPFVIVYLRDVRHLPLSNATAVIAVTSAAALVGGLVTGSLIDRTSATTSAVLSFSVAAAGCGLYALAFDFWMAVFAAAVLGIGIGGNGGVWNSLIAESVPAERLTDAFGTTFAAANASIGIGGLVGGLIVTPRVPATFQLLYLGDAVALMVCAVLVVAVTRALPVVTSRQTAKPAYGAYSADTRHARRGYLAVLSDGLFGPLMVLVVLINVFGYGQFDSALPAYATRPGGVAVRWLALIYACNTFGVIVLQLLALPLVTAIRRTSALAATSVAWAATWLLVLAAGLGGSSVLAGLGFVAASFVFAVGEVLYAPTVPALANGLAPSQYRGRYNSTAILATTLGMIVGPLLAGTTLQAGRATVLFVGLAIGCCLLVPAWLGFATVLPASANGRPEPAAAVRR